MPRQWSRKAEADTNVLKQDIAVVIAQTREAATVLYDALNFNYDTIGQAARNFYSNFFALYDSTRDQLDLDGLSVRSDNYKDAEEFMGTVEKHLQDAGEEMFSINEDGQTRLDQGYVEQGLSLYRLYKSCLRQAGMLDLAQYSPQKRGIGGKDLADQIDQNRG